MKHGLRVLLSLIFTVLVQADTLQLNRGWNLVGINANLTLEEIQYQIGQSNLLVIQGENKTYQRSYAQQSLNALNDFTAFEMGKGYWVKIVQDVNLSYTPMSYSDTKNLLLAKGWNLINPLDTLSLETLFSQLGQDNVEVIQSETQTYQKEYLDKGFFFLNDLTQLEASKAYWIKIKNGVELAFTFTPTAYYSSDLSEEEQKQLNQKIVRMQKSDEINIDAITPNIVEIALIPPFNDEGFTRLPIDINATHNVLNFTITSSNDSNYENNTHPTQSGLKRRVMSAPIDSHDLRILERIYLKLPYDLQEENNYTLSIEKNVSGTSHDLSFSYKHNRISSLIHLDPEGYLPNDKKKAYMGMQLGSLGEVVADDVSFVVKRVDNREIVYSGEGTIEASSAWRENFTNLETLYQHVVEFDFSALTDEGEYIIESPIAGISQPFTINGDAYRKTLNTLALGVYNQRRGEDIKMPYSRHERLSTIENNTYIYSSDDLDPFITGDNEFGGIKYPTNNEGKKVTFEAAGHMDAGDYSPYTYNSSEFTWTLLAGLDLFGSKVLHDNLGVPESNDNIPDIYQEMMIELKWLMGMQDDDGGVFGMSKPKGQSYQNKMTGVDTNIERYLSPKDTPHTASFTAVMARAARSKIIKQYNPELNSVFKEKALKAWAWLEENEGYDGWHHYGAKEGDVDDRVWASIELYALTGEEKYHDYFVANHKPEKRDNGVEWFNHGYGYANRVVAMWDKEEIPYTLDSTMKTQCINRYKAMLEHFVGLAESTPYDLVLEWARKRWNQLGWYFPLYQYGYDLAIGHYLYEDERYLETLKDQIHFTLGANPSNSSAITGIGNKRLHSLVDQKSRFDGLDQPVNGLPVSPIVSGASWLDSYERNLTNYTYPSTTYDFSDGPAYGLLDEVYDGWNINAEFTIEKLGAMLVTLGYVTQVEEKVYAYPKFSLELTAIDNGKFKTALNFIEKPESGKVVWYANGLPVSVNPNFILEQDFDEPTYKLGAEFIDKHGRRWFDEVLVNTRDYNNSNIPLVSFESEPLTHLWHFDTNLSSDTGIDLTYEGNAYLDDSNLYWMKNSSGKALRVENYGDGVSGSIFMEEILEGRSLAELDAVTVEALIYPEKLLDRGSATAEIIKFEQSWGAQLQLLRFTWDYDLKTRLARHVLGEDEQISDALTEHEWHYVKMKIDRYRVYFYLDGEEIYAQERVQTNLGNLFDTREVKISLGDFTGWIDEFRISLEVSEVHQDSDSDGLPDSWENAYGFNVLSTTDALEDSDGDGYTNLEEYQNLTNPEVEDSYFEPIGTNLSSVVDWTTQLPFVDYFKFARTWITQCKVGTDTNCSWSNSWDTKEENLLDLDSNGWVKSLPIPEDGHIYSSVATVWDMPKSLPKGRYVVLYEGEGLLEYRLGATLVESDNGWDVIDVDMENGLIQMVIVQTDPNGTGDYLRHIKLLKEEDESNSATFNSDFLERIRPFKVLRFMDWQRTNNSDLCIYEDRSREENYTYATDKGVPLEIMVRLANELEKTPWFTIPHQADDNFIRGYAKVIKTKLDINIPLYVEYSNEVWNGMFEQSSWVERQAEALWSDSTSSAFTKKINWYGMRSSEMCAIFKEVFSDQPKRVNCVLSAQAANVWTASQALKCPLVTDGNCSKDIDALAIAPYFGAYIGQSENQEELESWAEESQGGLEQLFRELSEGGVLSHSVENGALHSSFTWMENHKAVANEYHLKLLAYEGGQHLVGVEGVENVDAITNLFMDANRDERMGDLYLEYLAEWKARGGGVFMNFSDIGAYSKWGSWGALESVDQNESAKYDALMEYMGK
ncbi:MAG: cellulose-binding domain protein [uncultured Sulfurovum sp.]|uniref:Cellulose-binding domain protein n=1 Tax=uncultured Sulfurovum sp. TaxID=269237 RepID=A0A6S6TM72_9BACT|nr:MAG: cellulose-binding domain protein [uncultured Sulfurovum sp.]